MANRFDPYRKFKYKVAFSGFPDVELGFSSVSGLTEETTAIEYREGNETSTPRKVPGMTNYDNIVLERGMGSNTFMLDWRKKVFDRNRGFFQYPDNDFRLTVYISLWSKAGGLIRDWKVLNAWPTIYETDDLQADGDEILMERVELAHEGIIHTPYNQNSETGGFGF